MTRPYVRCTPELMERFLVRIAEGETLTGLAADPAWPSTTRLLTWLRARPEMKARYLAACAGRTHMMRRRGPRQGGQRELAPVYTEALAERICDNICLGMTVRQVLALPDMPSFKTLFLWLDRYPDFAGRYAFACEMRAQALADEVVAIADNCLQEHDPEGGPPLTPRDQLKRAALRIAVRKHRFAAMTPKRYRWEWTER